ncbi:Protein of uncharacterised function (DUF2505) [Dermatophilus congolensis]|uniref:Protein of uncharacterized function (DUF2505) n=1 Tax=Dermatophilus congolensis TaxID=1863 RepID=A0AA46H025_9MICO|nr:DUF2505 domain-containing protein [Dermatophilus congolensis]STD06841.1 Protein of uncharacterised function (DUF2505) [Dermatophilus congolensis]
MHVHETFLIATTAEEAGRRLTDEAIYHRGAEHIGAHNADVHITQQEDAFNVEATFALPTTGMPSAAARLAGPTLTVRLTQHWEAATAEGTRTSSVNITAPGTPVTGIGTLNLRPTDPDSCQLELDADITAAVPLFGPSIEKAAAPALVETIRAVAQEIGTPA